MKASFGRPRHFPQNTGAHALKTDPRGVSIYLTQTSSTGVFP